MERTFFYCMGRLVMGCLVMGCLVMGRLVMGRFVCESILVRKDQVLLSSTVGNIYNHTS